METIKSCELFFKDATSDKVYKAFITSDTSGCYVNFEFGKRGTKLQSGTKTITPISMDKADIIFAKLIKEKKSKGYTEDVGGNPFSEQTDKNRTEYLPQLLNVISEQQIEMYLKDDLYIAQQKMDGMRVIIENTLSLTRGFNRNGLEITLPKQLSTEIESLHAHFVLDGELAKDVYYVFDVLNYEEDLRGKPLQERLEFLDNIFQNKELPHVKKVETYKGSSHKRELIEKIKENNGEGIVFKNRESIYEAGRPNSNGNQLKFKFVTTASVIVTGKNEKQSISIGLLNNNQIVSVGNVKIPPNKEVPNLNDVVEVQYLYAFTETNALFQPIYLGKREDIHTDECMIDQLKYKID